MLLKFLANYRDIGLLIMRIGLGIAYILHAYPKFAGGAVMWRQVGGSMRHLGIGIYPEFWGFLAATTEGLGGILLILGALYRPVCLALMFTMIVATITLMQTSDFKAYSHPLKMAFVFFGLAFAGPGKLSVDKD